MKCNEPHNYIIDSRMGFSDRVDSADRILEIRDRLPAQALPEIIAFHPVPTQQLVDNPDTIQTYCVVETNRVEAINISLVKGS